MSLFPCGIIHQVLDPECYSNECSGSSTGTWCIIPQGNKDIQKIKKAITKHSPRLKSAYTEGTLPEIYACFMWCHHAGVNAPDNKKTNWLCILLILNPTNFKTLLERCRKFRILIVQCWTFRSCSQDLAPERVNICSIYFYHNNLTQRMNKSSLQFPLKKHCWVSLVQR